MSSNVMLTLKNILVNGESDYTLDDLKTELGLTNDKSLINFLLRFLKEEIEEVSFDEMMYEQTAVDIIYSYLSAFITEDRQCDIESVISRLKFLESYIEKRVRKIKTTIKHQPEEVSSFEKDFWYNASHLNEEVLKLIKVSSSYKGDNGNYCLLEDMVHKIKNLHLLQEVNTRFPRLFLECDKDGQPFFNHLLSFYLELIKDEQTNINDIIYYDMVMDLFLNNEQLKIDKKMKDSISHIIDQVKRNKKSNKELFKQRIIFLHHLKKKLMKEEKYVSDIYELNNKYKCNIAISDEGAENMESYFKALSDVYHDFTNKDVITIDPFGSLDLDDGISLEKLKNNNYLLGVYITDVSDYVAFNSCDDINALHRCETLYSGTGVVNPMLPRELTFNQCSLLPGNMRKAIVCFFEIEPDGNIKRHFFSRGIIKTRNHLHFSYMDVNRILKNGSDDLKITNTLTELNKLSKLGLLKNISTEEPHKIGKIEAHTIVDKFMVLTNHIAAVDAKTNGVPFLYRSHQVIKPRLIIDNNPSLNILINDLTNPSDSEMVKKLISGCFSRAYYTTESIPHEGLGLAAYAHTTSPLRRYSDLINQRLIKLFLIDQVKENKISYQIEEFLNEVAEVLNSNQLITNQYMNDYAHILRK